jgi:recombinational DNA repair ATPase RecF
MKKILEVIILLFLVGVQSAPAAQSQAVRFSDIQSELEANVGSLAGDIEQFEAIQRAMDASGKANDNYNQQKNIFLSSVLAISTIIAVCEYESNLLTLFIDLKEKNRRKYYDVRIMSLETAVRQIETMYQQIQINYTIFPPNFFEAPLVRNERLAIQSAIKRLNRCSELLGSVNQR